MRFWDASALVPLWLVQPQTAEARSLYDQDAEIAVWWGTLIECVSAIARGARDGILDRAEAASARTLLDALSERWYEIPPAAVVREHAVRLLDLHPLRAADSLQLAAGLEWAGTDPAGEFVTFDERLKAAARLEGLSTPC